MISSTEHGGEGVASWRCFDLSTEASPEAIHYPFLVVTSPDLSASPKRFSVQIFLSVPAYL